MNDTPKNGPEDQQEQGARPEESNSGVDEPAGPAPEPAGQTAQPGGGPEAPTEQTAQAGGGPQAPAAQPQAPGGRPRRLLRSRESRVIGGVCGGLGEYFRVDPILFRIAAIALVFVGGAGVLLYLAALLLIPSEGDAGPPSEGRGRALGVAAVVVLLLIAWPVLLGGGLLLAAILIPVAILVGAGVLAWWLVSGEGPSGDASQIARRAALGVGVLILCCMLALCGAWAAAAGGGTVVAVLVILAGIAILAGSFARPVRWLILPAVVLALSAGVVSAAGITLDGGVGQREYRPSSVADLRDRYELGMGELVVDLRAATLPPGDTPLEIDLGIGEARLLVSEDVCVATRAQVGMGEARVFDRDNAGVDVDVRDTPLARADTPRLLLDAEVGLGELRVGHEDDHLPFRDVRFGRRDDGTGAGNAACSGDGGSR
jgi:phage shock protein PspC (stress-responsive transcriptional regulator)